MKIWLMKTQKKKYKINHKKEKTRTSGNKNKIEDHYETKAKISEPIEAHKLEIIKTEEIIL